MAATRPASTAPCLAATLLVLSAAANPIWAQPAESPPNEATRALHALFEAEWEDRLARNPRFATSVGDLRYNDQLGSATAESRAAAVEASREFLAQLAEIDREQLSNVDKINASMFQTQLENLIDDTELGGWQMPINADSGFHMGFARLARSVPLTSTEQYRDYISRLGQWSRYVDEQIANMRVGLERGMTVPQVVLKGYEDTISAHVVDDPTTSDLYEPFESFPVTVPESDREALRAEAREAIETSVIPGYRKFLAFMTEEYIPGARTTLGASELPEGHRYYALQIRDFTTLDLSPDQIHEIGLAEVKRIRAEMDAVIEEVGFEGSFAEFLEFLRTDPQFYPKTARELLERAAYLSKKMDGKLPSLFATLPRLPYTVEPVPDSIAPKYTAGRYVGPSEGTYQPGIYWVNTYALDTRPFYALTALTLHEAVPGHHLQNALAKEQEGLPNFRRYSYLSAFGEGWGLYSEWLGVEADMYETPYDHFGRLTYEMWRAVRLVVDTGVHAKGWTREQMLDYMASNTALSIHEITTETDRYISWPGQALAYKLGEIEIKRLRKRAEAELGSSFDVRTFHDAVLLNGAVPLPVLEEQIETYIAAEKSAMSGGGR